MDEEKGKYHFRLAEDAEIEGNYAEAWKHYLLAGTSGHPGGIESRQLTETKIDPDLRNSAAQELLREHRPRADQADPDVNSCVITGLLLLKEWGHMPDHLQAVEYFKKAAEAGHAVAYYNLGVVYERGMGVEKNARAAFEWYLKAAQEGHAGAMNNLGFCASRGWGCEKSLEQANAFYEEAAEKGHMIAIQNMGIGLLHGEGVEKDIERGLLMMKKAANFGLTLAQREGRNVDRDIPEALYWFMRAARNGDKDAEHSIANLKANFEVSPVVEQQVSARIVEDESAERTRRMIRMLGDDDLWEGNV